MDVAFIDMTKAEVSFSNAVGSKTIVARRYITPAPGSVVGKIGRNGSAQVKLVTNFGSADIGGVWVTDLMEIELCSQSGDSGGLIYIDAGSSSIKVVGIIKGRKPNVAGDTTIVTKGGAFPWSAWPENP